MIAEFGLRMADWKDGHFSSIRHPQSEFRNPQSKE